MSLGLLGVLWIAGALVVAWGWARLRRMDRRADRIRIAMELRQLRARRPLSEAMREAVRERQRQEQPGRAPRVRVTDEHGNEISRRSES